MNNLKKYMPFILVLVGLLVIVGVFTIFKKGGTSDANEEANVKEIPVNERPSVALIPSSDGHWLKLKIAGIKVAKAESLDYELIYSTVDGGQQGVPGTVSIVGQTSLERDLLLGSESSGKFRYDSGVDHGTLTLRFRDGKGKLIGKLATDFHLQSDTDKLTSVDGVFSYTLSKMAKGVFYVTMQTFADPASGLALTSGNGYSVFASE